MQAIKTKFLPATNFKGSRIKAVSEAGSIVLNWNHELDCTDNHIQAAVKLCQKFGWKQSIATGSDKKGFYHVPIGKNTQNVTKKC